MTLIRILTFVAVLSAVPAVAQAQTSLLEQLQSVHERVETFFWTSAQLTSQRVPSQEFDRTFGDGVARNFSTAINREVIDAVTPRSSDLSAWYLSEFDVPERYGNTDVSLFEMPMCRHSRSDMAALLGSGRVVTDNELVLINAFVDAHNEARESFVAGGGATSESLAHWSALMGCLAYTESLGDPDTAKSIQRSKELLGPAYEKPRGVKFYYDRMQDNPESRWNVGLFQFVLKSGGNISPCVSGWNKRAAPSQKIPRGDIYAMADYMASPGQSLNAYCGVHKILETFLIQKFTTNPARTHPDNVRANGQLKAPKNRCATVHARRAYTHFGPFIRSDGSRSNRFSSNLDKLLQCTRNALRR